MKHGEFNLEDKAIDCSGLQALGDAGKEIFTALKIALGCDNNGNIDFNSIDKFQAIVIDEYYDNIFNMWTIEDVIDDTFDIIQPSDVLGQPAIDAAMNGSVLVFEGELTELYPCSEALADELLEVLCVYLAQDRLGLYPSSEILAVE